MSCQKNWVKTAERPGYVVEERISSRGLPSIRVQCDYEFDALTVWRAYCDPQNRKDYDPLVSEVVLTKHYGVNLYNFYQRTHKILMVAPREFNLYMFINIEEDGSILMILFTNEDDPREPMAGTVMGGIPYGAIHITPDPKNPKRCSMNCHLEIDLSGNIPEFVTKQIVSFQCNGLVLLKKTIEPWLSRIEEKRHEPVIE